MSPHRLAFHDEHVKMAVIHFERLHTTPARACQLHLLLSALQEQLDRHARVMCETPYLREPTGEPSAQSAARRESMPP